MEPTALIKILRYDQDDLPRLRQTLIDVHADAFADAMDDPFNQRFPWFVDHWGANPAFACVVAYNETEPVGFSYGAPPKPNREWWREHWTPDGDSTTFAVSELMVRPQWRKTGISQQLHDALLADRPEALAVLLVDVTHPKVRTLYESWGYEKVGDRQPFADSPLYTVMIKHLRPA
jgi:GNAT superfamily N-acetyltransferase